MDAVRGPSARNTALNPHRSPPGLAWYHRSIAQETRPSDDLMQPLRTRIRFLRVGTLIRMSGGRLPKRIVFGNLEGAVRRVRGRKEREGTNGVQSNIRVLGIAGDWKMTALKAEVWVEMVTECERRLTAAWRKEEVAAGRYRQE